MQTNKLLLKQFNMYPYMQPEDVFKFLYQSVFGCEHLVADEKSVVDYIKSEYENTDYIERELVQALDGDYSRVYLGWLDRGLSADTLGKLFCLSAKCEKLTVEELEEKLLSVGKLTEENKFSFSYNDYKSKLEKWKSMGYPSLHHSDFFRKEYKPAYRVIANEYVQFLPLFAKIDEMLLNGRVNLAIEGGSASGKSTLADILAKVYDCNVFHMDDFFLRPEQRMADRFAEAGGNVDRERFFDEVVTPLSKGEEINYRRFDCSTLKVLEPVKIMPKKLNVTEGAYSMHPYLSGVYNLSVFLDVTEDLQKKRILKRNSSEFAKRFFDEWIPFEHKYFDEFDIKNKCSLIIEIK